MGKIANAIILACTVLGTVFTAAVLYLAAAPFFEWWPVPQKLPAGAAATIASPGIISAGVLWAFGALGVALLLTAWLVILNRRKTQATAPPPVIPAPAPIATSLRLQFHPNSVIPTGLSLQNVANWYSLCHIFTVNESPTKRGKEGKTIQHRQWSLFLVFDLPVLAKQIIVNGNGANLPLTEVKDRSSRHAVITIAGDVGSAVIDINVIV